MLPPNQKNYIKVYQYAYRLKRRGRTPAQIKQALMLQGVDEKASTNIADNIERFSAALQKKEGETNMLQGAAAVLGSIIITIITRNTIANNHLCYAIAGFTALWGAVMFVRGLVQRLRL